jgi:integrase
MRKAKGRGNGEGSLYEYGGKWWAAVTLPTGRPKRRSAKTQREAREKLKQLLAELDKGVKLDAEQPTVAEWCSIWLEKYTKTLKPNIREDYRGIVRRYIEAEAIGRVRLHKLTPAQVQDWVDALQARQKPLSAQTVRNAHARLHKALKEAVKRRYRADNPAEDTDLPAVRSRPIKPLTFAQTGALLDKAAAHRWYLLYRLAVNLGLRQGELLGLTWDAVDFESGTIHIHQQLRRVPSAEGGKLFALQSVKTKSGERVLAIDDDLVAELRAYRKDELEARLTLGARWRDPFTKQGGLVFTSESGGPIHASNLIAHFDALLAAAGLPKIRFHDLRHTAATLMLADSVPLVTVSKILGHSSPAVTANIYAHALDTSKASAIAGLSAKLRRAQ